MSLASETPVPATAAFRDDARESLIARLRDRIRDYFPELDADSWEIRLVRQSYRTYSAFYEFAVSDHSQSHGVIVKVPYLPSSSGAAIAETGGSDRPRLFGMVDPRRMAEFEYESLKAIAARIGGLNDPRLGAIRPLDLWRDPNCVVMEKHHGTSLRQLRRAAWRIPIPAIKTRFLPETSVRNAAVWLRMFHQMTPLPQTTNRMASKEEFTVALAQQASHLIARGQPAEFLREIRAQWEQHAKRLLPAQLELATSHGDYAPRNLLIGRDNQVTVLDTLARWRAPIYEDIATFLLGLRASAAQMITIGWAYNGHALRRFESEFLRYYFDGRTVPLASIRLFEGILLLDRWSAFVHRAERARGRDKCYAQWRLITLRRFLLKYFRRTCRELDQLG